MSSMKSTLKKLNLKWQFLLTPDFFKSMRGKGDAKELEKLINVEKKLEEMLKEALEQGESELFEKGMNNSLSVVDKEKDNEGNVHSINVHFEMQLEERISKIVDQLNDLKKFADSKKIDSKFFSEDFKSIERLVSELRKMSTSQRKMDYNLVHDHQALARFIQLRNLHSVANRLKVLEKRAKREVKSEKREFDDISKDISNVKKSKSMDEFKQMVAKLNKDIEDYVKKAALEFKDLVGANRMDAILINHSLEYIRELKSIADEAQEKGYDREKYHQFVRRLNQDYAGYHDMTRSMLNEDKASMEELKI